MGLRVMDQSAILLARDYHLPIHVFDFNDVGAMAKICRNVDVGTVVSDEGTQAATSN